VKIAVAMSGGVDSSVTALLLKEKGYDVVGITLKLSSVDSCNIDIQVCCSDKDILDAKNVANHLGIPHYVFIWEDFFNKKVIKPFIEDYKNALTPNPCCVCNREVKTGGLAKFIKNLGFDYLATGHYAKIEENPKYGKVIKRGKDTQKDQSYFLALLEKEILDYIMFPIGDFTKEEIREIAKKYKLPVSQKSDSFEICFTAGKTPAEYIYENQLLEFEEGEIVHISGKVLGKHNGIINYTIGQRRGLGVAWKEPLYVIEKDKINNKVIVGEIDCLLTDRVSANNLNFFVEPDKWEKISVQGRYKQKPVPVKDFEYKDGILTVYFEEKQPKFAKGQILAVYDNDILLAGGIIT